MNIEKRGDCYYGIETEAERFMCKLGWRQDIPGLFIKGTKKTNNIEETLKTEGYIYNSKGVLCKMVPLDLFKEEI